MFEQKKKKAFQLKLLFGAGTKVLIIKALRGAKGKEILWRKTSKSISGVTAFDVKKRRPSLFYAHAFCLLSEHFLY